MVVKGFKIENFLYGILKSEEYFELKNISRIFETKTGSSK